MAAPVLVDAKKETFQRLKEASRPNMYLVPDVSGSSALDPLMCSVPFHRGAGLPICLLRPLSVRPW